VAATPGTLDAPVRTAPGRWHAAWHGPPDAPRAQLRAMLDNATAGCTYTPPGDEPTGLVVRVEPTEQIAGGPPVRVTAELTYVGGHRPQPRAIELHADAGELVERRESETSVTAQWKLPDRRGPRATVTARAGALTGEASVTLRPGPAARLRAVAPPRGVESDGASSTRFAVVAEDAFGNVTAPGALAASADGQVQIAPDGQVRYTAPRRARGGSDEIALRDASGATVAVKLRLRAPSHAFALAARVGYLTNFGKISGALVGVDGEYRLPWLHRRLSVGLEADVYDSSWQDGSAQSFDLHITGVPLLARIGFRQPLGPVGLSATAGGGVVLGALAIDGTTVGSSREAVVAGAFAARLAFDADVRLGRLLVELGYLYAPRSGGIEGNFGGLVATVGWRLDL
jgi:hypothetical protein